MDLRESDIRVIRNLLEGPKKSKDVAKALNLSSGRVSQMISNLIKKGFIEKKNGKYYLSKSAHAEAIRLIIQKHPALSIEKILTKNEFRILSSLYGQHRSIKEIAKHVGVTERTVYYKLDNFKTMGLVREVRDGQYGLNKRHDAWADLSKLLSGEIHQTLPLFLDDKDGWYAWVGKQEYIIKTTNPDILLPYIEKEGFHWKYTTTSALRAYGIDLTPREVSVYVYSLPDKIKSESGMHVPIEDVIVHLFLENHKKADEYVKSLIQLNEEKINLYYLQDSARNHGVNNQVKNVQYELKPVLDIVRYNKDRFQILFERLNSGEETDFSIESELENYWGWIDSFGRGENLEREEEIIKVIEYVSSLSPPLFKPLPLYYSWIKDKDHERCLKAANLLGKNAELAFSNQWYWTATWCYKKTILCYNLVKKDEIKTILASILNLVYSADFGAHHKRNLIQLVIDNLDRLEDIEKQKLLSALLDKSKKYYELATNKNSKEFMMGLNTQRNFLSEALVIAQKTGNNPIIKDIRMQLGASHETEGDLKNVPLVSTSHYEDALREYAKAGDKKAQNRVKDKIERLYPKIQWKKIESPPIEFDFRLFDEGIKDLLNKSPKKILVEIASAEMFNPNLSSAEKITKDIAQQSPIQFILPHRHTRDGLPVDRQTGPDEIFRHQVETQFMLEAQLKGLYLERLLDQVIERKAVTQKDVQEFLVLHGVNQSLAILISTAFERHVAGDYISSITTMVSQVESLIRQKLKEKGVITTRAINPEFGLQEATLGVMLEKELRPDTIKLLGEDMTEYLRLYLTNKTTGNLRHRIAHGLMKPEEYTKDKSTRLLQIILYIANSSD